MDVSFVIVSWNAKDLLEKCLRSVVDHKTTRGIEILVVDNASSDGAPEMVAENFPQVRLYRNVENLGFAKANNIGIRESTGRYVCLINSDIILLPGCVDSMIDYMEKHGDIGILSPKLVWPNGDLLTNCKTFPTPWNTLTSTFSLWKIFPKSKLLSGREMLHFSYDEIADIEVIAGSFWMVRRSAINDVGLLDESFFFYSEDLDWCRRFWRAGWKIVFFPHAQAIHHHGGSSSRMPFRMYVQQHKSSMHYWRIYHGIWGTLFIGGIIFFNQIMRVMINYSLSLLFCFKKSEMEQLRMKTTRSLLCLGWFLRLIRLEDIHR
jgi:GT2 family glycosyltransferase